MSAVVILVPVVTAAWPVLSGAVMAAAASLGYSVTEDVVKKLKSTDEQKDNAVTLDIPNSEVVMSNLDRDQRIKVARDGVTVAFSRNGRGKAQVCVTGQGRTDEALQSIGKELSQRVVQKYVYQRLLNEAQARQFIIVEEKVEDSQAIHIKIRHWEN